MFKRATLTLIVALLATSPVLVAQNAKAAANSSAKKSPHKGEISDAQYTAQALSAAPAGVAKEAGVMRVNADGSMKTLRESKNGFTCMVIGTDRMCNDANSMEFIHALLTKQPPPDKVGISYMLSGDEGASNTDPYATGKTADNHWIVTGPHIMVFGPPSKTLGFTRDKDPDPTKPYMMWAGTPYEHAMIPVGGAKKK
ncbi:MAG: hypothetical protein ACM3JB_16410 [Acidobacteriaceae bacterium]